MHYSSNHWSLRVFIILLILCSCHQVTDAKDDLSTERISIQVDTVETLSQNKLDLTVEYSQYHYGRATNKLDSPRIVVIHHTVIPTLQETIDLFKKDYLASNRVYINQFGLLNVGIHYVIDKDGSIYNLMPDTIIARHIIGFNHVSIGIENVAKTSGDLTSQQLSSNVKLVQFLASKYPTIEYLIGHDEYKDQSLPHFDLFLELDTTYLPHDKPDPGREFMHQLRSVLTSKHELVLKK